MILLLDNYDSFTHNLAHVIDEVLEGKPFDIIRNDQITVEECDKYSTIILSPGPGIPDEAGILKPLIAAYRGKKPILGVCLGCQAIGEVYGGTLENLDQVWHGVESPMTVTKPDELLFAGIESPFPAGRYHSWVISNDNFPTDLEITCIEENNQIMAIRAKNENVRGVQFHPESILTPSGNTMIANFLKSAGEI